MSIEVTANYPQSALLFAVLSAMAEIPSLFSRRSVVLRQYRAAMYHPYLEAAALTIVDLPIQITTMTAFAVVIYFLAGLQESAAQFL